MMKQNKNKTKTQIEARTITICNPTKQNSLINPKIERKREITKFVCVKK